MTDVDIQARIGPSSQNDGDFAPPRLGRLGDQIVSELHGRFYETNYRAALFSDGMGLTSISNATFTVGGIGATTTPVAGLWNPSTSGVNAVIIEASLGVVITNVTATGPGGFVWAMSVGNGGLTLGSAPLNRKTLVNAGAFCKGLTNVALTGITNAIAVKFASALGGGSAYGVSFVATAVAMQTQQLSAKELFDGSLIVPPGGVLALLATTTPVAHSAVSGLVWEEVPI